MFILLTGLLGLALGVYLVLHAGFAEIMAVLAVAGWGLLWLLPFHLLPLALDTLSWKWLLRGKARAPFGFLLWLALIRESVNGLLPVARIGGELLGIRMLSQYGVSPYVAGASVMVEITLTLVSQFLFALLGIVVLLFAVSNHLLVFEVLGFLFLSIPVLVIFSGCKNIKACSRWFRISASECLAVMIFWGLLAIRVFWMRKYGVFTTGDALCW